LFRLKKKKRIGLHYFDPAHFIHFFYQTPFYSFILSAHSFLHVLFFSTFYFIFKKVIGNNGYH
jgi:polyferredoxin